MQANGELAPDFHSLNREYKRLVAALLESVDIPGTPLEAGPEGDMTGGAVRDDRIYHVVSGSLDARYRGRKVYTLECGDLLLPDILGSAGAVGLAGTAGAVGTVGTTGATGKRTGEADQTHPPRPAHKAHATRDAEASAEARVTWSSDSGAGLTGYPLREFMGAVFADPEATRLWTRLLITQAGMGLRLAAGLAADETPTTAGFEVYHPGDIIVRQGDAAEFVYHLAEGAADVTVDGVRVGGVEAGEIFGAMAVLTNSERNATVRARCRCSVVKVPGDQFTSLIRSNPATIHGLLVHMANSIAQLNEQLVSLRGSHIN